MTNPQAGKAGFAYAVFIIHTPCHPAPQRGDTVVVIPSDVVRRAAKHRGPRNLFFRVAQRHH